MTMLDTPARNTPARTAGPAAPAEAAIEVRDLRMSRGRSRNCCRSSN
jgi:hypothetical protein